MTDTSAPVCPPGGIPPCGGRTVRETEPRSPTGDEGREEQPLKPWVVVVNKEQPVSNQVNSSGNWGKRKICLAGKSFAVKCAHIFCTKWEFSFYEKQGLAEIIGIPRTIFFLAATCQHHGDGMLCAASGRERHRLVTHLHKALLLGSDL